jgi:hypothetical protein
MKIIKKADKNFVQITTEEWVQIGKSKGWLKESQWTFKENPEFMGLGKGEITDKSMKALRDPNNQQTKEALLGLLQQVRVNLSKLPAHQKVIQSALFACDTIIKVVTTVFNTAFEKMGI